MVRDYISVLTGVYDTVHNAVYFFRRQTDISKLTETIIFDYHLNGKNGFEICFCAFTLMGRCLDSPLQVLTLSTLYETM